MNEEQPKRGGSALRPDELKFFAERNEIVINVYDYSQVIGEMLMLFDTVRTYHFQSGQVTCGLDCKGNYKFVQTAAILSNSYLCWNTETGPSIVENGFADT